ncbi:hypothetical protein TraAM80_03771 [Trypanosoma rangeli]|uniref:Thioredoxin domain-containing protein n=1 Tax=Trypanosoma rangeli TaxID=5698 RepID=A0A3R7NI96_TRYRA|nr:uncharacterized protein TraAM80_03771 [Trypanosoma rangeli]RNF06941.1 hypothetical protein TraAM80_03771 [Trypanosoma rangeli]|eukprot:RNF06941.1 hypothetical protein TraAM80_03771 [Trypanosoma rangeli]
MTTSVEKRAREELVNATPTTQHGAVALVEEANNVLKKPRLGGEAERDENNDATGYARTPKPFAEFGEEEQQHPSVNGVSPDGDESEKGEMETSDVDVEDLTLFTSPTRARQEVAALDKCGTGPQCMLVPHPNQHLETVHARRRGPHTVGAVTTLYSLQQLEELIDAAPLPLATSDALAVSASAPPQLQLRAGETVLIVLQNGQGDGGVALQPATELLSNCRIFRLDLGELPLCEYEEKGAETRLNGRAEQGVATGLLPLFHTDSLLSLGTQGPHNIEHALRRVSSLLRADEILNPNEAALSVPLISEKKGDASNKSLDVAQHEKGEELILPALVMWRADGGAADEYCHKKENQHGSAQSKCEGDAQVPVAGTRRRGWPLVVKEFTALDQLHSLSLLTPVYTVAHLLRTVCARALFPDGSTAAASGTRSLIYFGASWCPPCMRIVGALPAMMKEDFPSNLTCVVKADMDLATPLFEFFGVAIIPTFVILDNDVLRAAGDLEALRDATISEEALSQFSEALRRSELGRIQNSQRMLVRIFIESHTGALKFDEDF